MTEKIRRLGDLEYTYWMMDLASRTNFSVLAVFEKKDGVSEECLNDALEWVKSRHPVLNVRIGKDDKGRLAFFPSRNAIPSEIVQMGQSEMGDLLIDGDVIDALNRQQHTSIETESGPLVRALLLSLRNGFYVLILTFHHSIADARSAMNVMSEMMTAIDGVGENGEKDCSCQISPEHFPLPLEEALSCESSVIRAAAGMTVYSALQTLNRLFLKPSSLPVADPMWPDERSDRFLLGLFDVSTTDHFVTAVKTEGVTVHSALCAAKLIALLDEFPSLSSIRSWLLTLVDLRLPAESTDLSLMISMVEFCQKTKRGVGLWNLAREIRARISRKVSTGFHLKTLPYQAGLIHRAEKVLKQNQNGSKTLLRLGQLSRPFAIPVSSIGIIPMPPCSESIRVHSMTFVVPLSSSGIWGSSSNTFGGKLSWNFTYASPSVPHEQSVRLALRSMDIVRNAARLRSML